MDQNTKPTITCPHCGSENIVVYRRGYNLALGVLGMVVFFFGYIIYWVIFTDYPEVDETTKELMVSNAEIEFIIAGLLGLLVGLIGINKLTGKCKDCKKKFSIMQP